MPLNSSFLLGGAAAAAPSTFCNNAKPHKYQYDINYDQTTKITGWGTWTYGLPGGIKLHQAVITKDRIYTVGGYNGSATVATVYTTTLNTGGDTNAWTTGTSLPAARRFGQLVKCKNRLHYIGGQDSGGTTVATVYTCPINADGTLGTWTTGGSLATAMRISQAITTEDSGGNAARVYLIGGFSTSGASAVIQYADINSDGTLGTWTNDTNTLPATTYASQTVVAGSKVHLLGGNSGAAYVTNIYTATIDSSGHLGTFSANGNLNYAVGYSQAFITNGILHLLGGYTGTAVTLSVQHAPMDGSGNIGSWTTESSGSGALSVVNAYSQVAASKDHIYIIGGGSTTSNAISAVYYATITGSYNDYMCV